MAFSRMRLPLAKNHRALSAVGRIFVREGLGELTALPGDGVGIDDLALRVSNKPARRAARSARY